MEEKTNEKIHILKFDFIGLPGNKQPKKYRESCLGFRRKKVVFRRLVVGFQWLEGTKGVYKENQTVKKMWERGWKRKSGTRYQQTGKPVEPLLFDSRLSREKDY
jgi:hypothetical protein